MTMAVGVVKNRLVNAHIFVEQYRFYVHLKFKRKKKREKFNWINSQYEQIYNGNDSTSSNNKDLLRTLNVMLKLIRLSIIYVLLVSFPIHWLVI